MSQFPSCGAEPARLISARASCQEPHDPQQLGGVGLSYLDPLAQWFVRISERFNAFVQQAAADGSLKTWIDNGLTALGLLGSALGSIVAIFAAVSTAASNAGGAGLAQFAGGLERIATIVSGPTFQGALTTVFQGAHASVSGLGMALEPLGALFVQIAPSLATFLALAVGGHDVVDSGRCQ